MKERTIIVCHDNGIPGQFGFSEYSEKELTEKYGTISFLIECLDRSGIHVYEVI